MLINRWLTVYDAGATFIQHLSRILCVGKPYSQETVAMRINSDKVDGNKPVIAAKWNY